MHDDLLGEIEELFNPELDEDFVPREYPHSRLTSMYQLNLDYLHGFDWEGASTHPSTRINRSKNQEVSALIKNLDVPSRLFEAGLRLYADSLSAYMSTNKQTTSLRFYPPALLTFWSAFEAFVRQSSEMMVLTCKDIPVEIAHYLREVSPEIDAKGSIRYNVKHRPVLQRYSVLLRYGFELDIDRGCKHWQLLVEAQRLRDYYTHIKVANSRSLSSKQVIDFMEAVLLGIIWPSTQVKRTLLLGVHRLYDICMQLSEMTNRYMPNGHAEEPFFHSWDWEDRRFMFYCPFTSVDTVQYPNGDEDER